MYKVKIIDRKGYKYVKDAFNNWLYGRMGNWKNVG